VATQKTSLYKNKQYRRRVLKRRALTGLSLIFFLLAGVAGYSVANSSLFNLTEVIVEGNQLIETDTIKELSGLRLGANILKISLNTVKSSIEAHPFVNEAEVRRNYPNKLVIKVRERSPLALAVYDQHFLAVDEAGYCLEVLSLMGADRSSLTRIIANDSILDLKPGQKTQDAGLLAALKLVSQIDPFFIENIREVQALSEWDLALITKEGLPVYFGPPENLAVKLQYYEEILVKNSAECNAQTLEYVDLRYDTQPVIKRKQQDKK
jgi:cell division protein FtsQ